MILMGKREPSMVEATGKVPDQGGKNHVEFSRRGEGSHWVARWSRGMILA